MNLRFAHPGRPAGSTSDPFDLEGIFALIRTMRRASASVKKICRYPVKGLSAELMERATLAAGQTIPCDRRYAIENGPIGFDPAAPAYFPKQRFLMLMRNERLARLDTRFDDATDTLEPRDRADTARGDLR